MIDRTVNLLNLFIMLVVMITLATNIQDAWNKSEPWEQNWVAIQGKEQTHSAARLIAAIKNARDQHEYSDVYKLEDVLESMYKPSGNVHKRFSTHEIRRAAEYVFLALLLLVIPIGINYVRHGKFKLWNKSA
jgi:hypothetical protein